MPSDAPVTTNDRRDTATPRHVEVSPTDSAVIRAKNKVKWNAVEKSIPSGNHSPAQAPFFAPNFVSYSIVWIKDGRMSMEGRKVGCVLPTLTPGRRNVS